ncbi:hypothetical protein [Roseovarius sp. ZX-A-9]|uniref:hypothetical protein n=1 Tax=Roseovarius sp. ZX-A-9 TaxID=3014783 RepID=UPI00232ABCF9|nr:hypothetical protein [Roseovarius sp. ZX-A-9]
MNPLRCRPEKQDEYCPMIRTSRMDMPGGICQIHLMSFLLRILRLAFAVTLLESSAQAGELLLSKNDVVRIHPAVWAAAGLELPEPDTALPIVGFGNSQDGVRLLRILNGQGDVNGFAGVVYDNRDRGHSSLNAEMYPRLTHLKYGAHLVTGGLDVGLAGRIILPAVVFGNSSMALERGAMRRSLPRLAMTNDTWREITPILYENNHIYVYPEHHDYDAEDLFPINWPYMITSQGSSRSDQLFLNAIALTLAALPTDTFAFLREKGLIAPTVQMILRHNLSTVTSREDYLSGSAHPAAFDGRHVRIGRMVEMASKLRPEDIPPLVRLRVIKEDFSDAAGLAGMSERLLDAPAAIGRLWRGFAWEREFVVTAEDTLAANERPITFEWRLLRGDPELVSIEPQGPGGRTARIKVAWHDPWTELAPGKRGQIERRMSRVDIGVFANNGVHDSAPSLISIDFPEHQLRRYDVGPDGEKRLLSIDYDAVRREAYFDPLLYWSAAWTDTARYDKTGTLSGWDRQDADAGATVFVPNDDGTPVPYEVGKGDKGLPVLRRVGE